MGVLLQVNPRYRDIAMAIRHHQAVQHVPFRLRVFQSAHMTLFRTGQAQLGAFAHQRRVIADALGLPAGATTLRPGVLVDADYASLDRVACWPTVEPDVEGPR